MREQLEQSVEELELSVRSINCLGRPTSRPSATWCRSPSREMLKYRNFGRKSLKEIQDILAEMGLAFGMDVSHVLLEPKTPTAGREASTEPAGRRGRRGPAEEGSDRHATP